MKNIFARFLKDESGVSAIEYGLIASLIAIAAIGAFKFVGSRLILTFNDVANNLSSQ
ncbi:MAG TPA: Flp family type IVb pilin [Methylocystis sp.]|jgi:pilus assembly protein Flp/PilA|nr:Flp family type IVb pilin [Methylocystis sp.]